jgi:hypothetical protein
LARGYDVMSRDRRRPLPTRGIRGCCDRERRRPRDRIALRRRWQYAALARKQLLLSKAGNRYAAWVPRARRRARDRGLRAFRATTLRQIDFSNARSSGYGFQVEMAYRVASVGGRIEEVPICFTDRMRGTSKMSWRIVGEAVGRIAWWGLRDRVLHRRRTPLRAASRPA